MRGRHALAASAVADDDPGEPHVGVLAAPCFDEFVESRLCHVVRGKARPGRCHRRADGGEVRDSARVFDELGECGSGEVVRPDDVGAEEPVPCLGVQVLDVADGPDSAGVDDAVDSAELADRFGHCSAARGGIGHVADDGPGIRPRFRRGFGQEVLAACHQCDLRPPLGQADADAAAQASGCADDNRPHARVSLMGRGLIDATVPPGPHIEFDVECYSVAAASPTTCVRDQGRDPAPAVALADCRRRGRRAAPLLLEVS